MNATVECADSFAQDIDDSDPQRIGDFYVLFCLLRAKRKLRGYGSGVNTAELQGQLL
jgi:hypothetical protein